MLPAILIPLIPVLVHFADSFIGKKSDDQPDDQLGADRKAFVMSALIFAWDELVQHRAIPPDFVGQKDAVVKLLDDAVEAAVARLHA